MVKNVSATLVTLSAIALIQATEHARALGELVGNRESKRGDLFVTVYGFARVMDCDLSNTRGYELEGELLGTVPASPYSINLGSVRWSPTQGKYVTVVNQFLGTEECAAIAVGFAGGLALGVGHYESLLQDTTLAGSPPKLPTESDAIAAAIADDPAA